jgi:hypothetical protein
MTVAERQQLHSLIDSLPASRLTEVQNWLQAFSYRHRTNGGTSTPFVPVVLGGLWAGELIDDEDIMAVRQEITASFFEGIE